MTLIVFTALFKQEATIGEAVAEGTAVPVGRGITIDVGVDFPGEGVAASAVGVGEVDREGIGVTVAELGRPVEQGIGVPVFFIDN